MALITWSWPRLDMTGVGAAPGGPVARKMSATSSAGRAKGVTCYVAGSAFGFSWPTSWLGQQVERALDAGIMPVATRV